MSNQNHTIYILPKSKKAKGQLQKKKPLKRKRNSDKPERHGKGWRIRWTDEYGRRQSETYTYKDYQVAVVKIAQHNQLVREIKLGMRTGIRPVRTVKDLSKLYLSEFARTKRSEKDCRSIITKHIVPHLGTIKLGALSTLHITRFTNSLPHLKSKTIANILILLRAMLNVAVDIGWLEKTPKIKVRKPHHNDENYRYLKTILEITRFLKSALKRSEAVHLFYKTALYTGMRAGELAGLKWTDVDFHTGIITVSKSYNGPTKNATIRRIPIFSIIRTDLEKWKLKAEEISPWVFPNARGGMFGPSSRIFQEVLHWVLEDAGFPVTFDKNGKTVRHITFHGLRHSFASHWMMSGGDLFKLQRILGHKSIEMTQRYSHLAPDAFAGDLNRFGSPQSDINDVIQLPVADSDSLQPAHRGHRSIQ